MSKKEMWIQEAIKKPGSLRKELGAKEGKNISSSKLEAASKKKTKAGEDTKTAKRARLALTLKKMHHYGHGGDTGSADMGHVDFGAQPERHRGDGMQMGPSGYGLTHGCACPDSCKCGESNKHEFKGCR